MAADIDFDFCAWEWSRHLAVDDNQMWPLVANIHQLCLSVEYNERCDGSLFG